MQRSKEKPGLASTVNAIAAQKQEQKKKEAARQRLIRIGKAILKITILLLVNVVLLILGAIVFQKMESYNEYNNCIEARNDFYKSFNATTELMFLAAKYLNDGEEITDVRLRELEITYQSYLRNFSKEVTTIKYSTKHNCSDPGSFEKWSISNSLVFALTVITTIGRLMVMFGVFVDWFKKGDI